jgi:hypothetical protein
MMVTIAQGTNFSIFAALTLVRCLRGRKEQFAKLSYGKLYRGFESLPHRTIYLG